MHANRRHIRLRHLQLFYAATPHLILFLSDICFDIGVLIPSFERTLLVICMSDQSIRQLEVLPSCPQFHTQHYAMRSNESPLYLI